MTETEDEFKDVGKYFGEGDYVTFPWDFDGTECTLMFWTIWMSEAGPLFSAEDGDWAIPYDKDGLVAYRIAGNERITQTPVASVRDRWSFIVLAKAGRDVTLWLDDAPIDEWWADDDSAPFSTATLMKRATGFAADTAWWNDQRLPNDRLKALWEAGKSRV